MRGSTQYPNGTDPLYQGTVPALTAEQATSAVAAVLLQLDGCERLSLGAQIVATVRLGSGRCVQIRPRVQIASGRLLMQTVFDDVDSADTMEVRKLNKEIVRLIPEAASRMAYAGSNIGEVA